MSIAKYFQRPAVRFLISALILGFLFFQFPVLELWFTVRQVPFLLWLAILAAFILGHILGCLKWSLIINSQTQILPFSTALRCYFAGLFANLCLPSLVGGDIIRAGLAIYYIEEKERVILVSLLDRIIDMCALGIIIVIGVSLSQFIQFSETTKILSFLGIIILFVLAGVVFFGFLPFPNWFPEKLEKSLSKVRHMILHLLKNPQRLIMALGLAIIMQYGFIWLNKIIGISCGVILPMTIWLWVWPLAKLIAMLPLSLGGVGLREAALAFLLKRLGIPFSKSVAVGLIWETILIAGGITGGIIYSILSKNHSALKDFKIAKNFKSKLSKTQ
jgi:uncharacterized protein (TIRG00374 family)